MDDFEQVVGIDINVVCNKIMPMLGEFNLRSIMMEEAWGIINEMKAGKASGLIGVLFT